MTCFFLCPLLYCQEGGFITIETQPEECQMKVYKWVPFERNKGEVIGDGKSPLKIKEESLKGAGGIVITVDGKEKGYINEERVFFPPYNNEWTLKLQSQKDFDTLKAQSNEYAKAKKEKKTVFKSKDTKSAEEVKQEIGWTQRPDSSEYQNEIENRNAAMRKRKLNY